MRIGINRFYITTSRLRLFINNFIVNVCINVIQYECISSKNLQEEKILYTANEITSENIIDNRISNNITDDPSFTCYSDNVNDTITDELGDTYTDTLVSMGSTSQLVKTTQTANGQIKDYVAYIVAEYENSFSSALLTDETSSYNILASSGSGDNTNWKYDNTSGSNGYWINVASGGGTCISAIVNATVQRTSTGTTWKLPDVTFKIADQ